MPQNPNSIASRYPAAADVQEELAKIPLSVKFPASIDRQIRSIPGYSAKVRQWVIEGLEREGEESPVVPSQPDLKAAIEATLWSIPPKERRQAQKYFQKLVDRLEGK